MANNAIDESQVKWDSTSSSNTINENNIKWDMPQQASGSNSLPMQSAPEQKSPIDFTDMLKMASLSSPQEQQNYLKSKFKFAEPNQDGSFSVGDDPTNLTPIHPGTMGDAAMSVLAKGASMIPVIAGQIGGALGGAALGTLAEGGIPGLGTIIGGILGAGGGAFAGEGAKNAMNSKTPGYDPEKAATDNVISGLFGVAGEGLGQAIGFGVKNYIAPKLAAALDGAIAKSAEPATSVKMMSKVMNFVAGVDQKEVAKGYQLGFKNVYGNHANLNPDEIDNIAQGITQGYVQKKGIASAAIDKAEESFLNNNPHAMVGTTDVLENVTDRLKEMKILDKIPASESGQEGMTSSFKFRTDLPSDVQNAIPDTERFLRRLGAQKSDGGVYHIPDNSNIQLDEAIGAKRLFQKTFNNQNFNKDIAAIAKTALYGEGPSAQYPKGFLGLRGAINDTAKASGNNAYIIANNNFSNLMNARDGILIDGNGNKSILPGWMDVENPSSVAKYMKNVNKLDAFGNQAISNLQGELGHDFTTPASQWAVAQAMSKARPQLLRLSVVGGLAGLALPGSPMERASRLPLAFGLGSPTGIQVMARGSEMAAKVASARAGAQMVSWLANTATNPVVKATASQLSSKKIAR